MTRKESVQVEREFRKFAKANGFSVNHSGTTASKTCFVQLPENDRSYYEPAVFSIDGWSILGTMKVAKAIGTYQTVKEWQESVDTLKAKVEELGGVW